MIPTPLAATVFAQAVACTDSGSPATCDFFASFAPARVAVLAGTVIPTALRIALICIVAYALNRLARRVIRRFIRDLTEQGLARIGALRARGPLARTGPIDLARATMRTETVGGVLRSMSTVLIFSIAFMLVVGQLGVQLGPLIAGAGIVGVALGFGAQSLVKDFLSGIFILLEDQYGVGDLIDLSEDSKPIRGRVESITLRVTRLRDVRGTVWYVPNGEIRAVGNRSQDWARSIIDIGVAHETDTDHASAVIKQVADQLWKDERWSSQVLEEPEVWGVQDFAPDAITLRLVVKTQPGRQPEVSRELRTRIKRAFDQEGIETSSPQRTVWTRDGNSEEVPDPR
ncbi:MAG: mechanosensitive ion channel family protein [Egibacteraceae bacterium]